MTSYHRITHIWWIGADSFFRGAGTIFQPNYCVTLTENSSLKKQNLVRNWILFLFLIIAEYWSLPAMLGSRPSPCGSKASRNFRPVTTFSRLSSWGFVPRNATNTWWNGAESHIRGTGTMFRPNYCIILAENVSLTKYNLVRTWIVFLFIVMADHLSVESLTLRFLDCNYVNIRVVLTLRLQIV